MSDEDGPAPPLVTHFPFSPALPKATSMTSNLRPHPSSPITHHFPPC